jgi:hypothetical protein
LTHGHLRGLLLAGVLAALATLSSSSHAADGLVCRPDAPGDAAWTRATAEQVWSSDALAPQVVAALGPPTACTGKRQASQEPGEFGTLTLHFGPKARLVFSFSPPETSVVTLTPGERRHDVDWLSIMKAYVTQRGLKLNWAQPAATLASGCEKRLRYESADQGLNASLAVWQDCKSRVREIRFALAL